MSHFLQRMPGTCTCHLLRSQCDIVCIVHVGTANTSNDTQNKIHGEPLSHSVYKLT